MIEPFYVQQVSDLRQLDTGRPDLSGKYVRLSRKTLTGPYLLEAWHEPPRVDGFVFGGQPRWDRQVIG